MQFLLCHSFPFAVNFFLSPMTSETELMKAEDCNGLQTGIVDYVAPVRSDKDDKMGKDRLNSGPGGG